MTHSLIYHICTENSWNKQLNSSFYTHESLDLEGFIHCSNEEQIAGVLSRYFKEINDLLLLTIQCEKVIAEIKYETAPNGEYFPHIFGQINKDAILKISKIDKSKSSWIT